MKPKQASPDTDRWFSILRLGEKLLASGSQALANQTTYPDLPAELRALLVQRDLILQTTRQLFSGEVHFWLSRQLLPGILSRRLESLPEFEMLFSLVPETVLMQAAIREKSIQVGHNELFFPLEATSFPKNAGAIRSAAIPLLSPVQTAELTAVQQPISSLVLGAIQIDSEGARGLRTADFELFNGLAIQVSLTFEAWRQMTSDHWRLKQLALVRKVSAQVANAPDIDTTAQRIVNLIQTTFHYYYVAIFTIQPGQDVLQFRASAGPSQNGISQNISTTRQPGDCTIRLGEGMIGSVALNGQEIIANDVRNQPVFRYNDSHPETLSEIALPLKVEDRVLGVLDVQGDSTNSFTDTDILVLHALADNLSTALEGASLYSALNRRAGQLSAVYEVSGAISSILDEEKLLNEIVTLLHKRLGYPYVHLFTIHPGRRKIFYEAGNYPRSQDLCEQRYSLDLDDAQGIIPWVARHGETVLANDVVSESRYRRSSQLEVETLSELAVPLIFGGEVLGILDIESHQRNAFSEEDRFLVEALASSIAIAMRNASLYRSEKWRRQVADSLREVSGLLSTETDLDQVLNTILIELKRVLPYDIAAIWLLESGSEGENIPGEFPALQLASIQGQGAEELDLETGLNLENLVKYNPTAPSPSNQASPALSASWLIDALTADQPFVRPSLAGADPLSAALEFPADYSAIAAPLRAGSQRLGLLTLAHRMPERYGGEARAMAAAFASYAAIAIENTRLYEAAHEQAWVATVLLQVTEATQSLTNLNDLLATVTRITPMLVGVNACVLFMLDVDGIFIPSAASGLSPEQQAEFERWRFAPGDVPVLDRLIEEKQPVILHRNTADLRLSGFLHAGVDVKDQPPNNLLVLVPLLSHQEVLGTFLVDYSNDHQELVDPEAIEEFFDERLAIIQGIAHQTAIAVENIHLLKQQKEEAYVSVALLQVAQAIVSANDLEAVLESIVRITPILVGIRRAAIYLWEPERQTFRLAQSYGLGRDEPVHIPIGEFPILDAILIQDRLLAHPVEYGVSSAEPVINAWCCIIPPDPEDVEDYLAEEDCLLLAIPLSIKGEVLGVFLVEEPLPVLVDELAGNNNRRLREKRLEIITGISQQAAMAIQNEQLQQEMVKQERLEREIQLARDIQRTFLPHEAPAIPGWELDFRWRTARQVGGDFYDFFDLPGNRLGLVIADVADKGMPAALFMTVVRTLVRAVSQQLLSPAEVLKNVNESLIPDAEQGMFVSIFYAVLDIQNGRLIYSNAGHNPPLLLRQRGKIEPLTNCGMALGVEAGLRLTERRVTLHPGEALILYTDGLTEAFSTTGEMYGENRLQNVLTKDIPPARRGSISAHAMLDIIVASLSEFLDPLLTAGNTSLGYDALEDDLTLIVLKREKPLNSASI